MPAKRAVDDKSQGTVARDNHVLACNFAEYLPILKSFPLTDSAANLSYSGY